MNVLPTSKRSKILHTLAEGTSMRATARLEEVSVNTVMKLLAEAGQICAAFHDRMVRGIVAKRVECDELWAFAYAKAKRVGRAINPPPWAGDVWAWTAIEAETKLIISWHVGDRDTKDAKIFLKDLRSRIVNRVQLTSDAHHAYLEAVEETFGIDVDYAQLVKIYGQPQYEFDELRAELAGPRRERYLGARRTPLIGNPSMGGVSTSIIERHNLTIRMTNRRYTRRTNAHSKTLENHIHAFALNIFYYNFIRGHMSLKNKTPAMETGLLKRPVRFDELVGMIDAAKPPPKRGPYKKRKKKRRRRKDSTQT